MLFGEILGDRRSEFAVFFDLEPGEALRPAVLADPIGQHVDIFAAVLAGCAAGVDAADFVARIGRTTEDAELALRRDICAIDQFHAVAKVRCIVAEAFHGFVVGHARER